MHLFSTFDICFCVLYFSGFISGLLKEKKDLAFAQLLAHLPLLHPNNTDAKTQYLSLFERLLPYATETSSCIESVQQLFTYIVIHPAFKNEKEQILLWKKFLENTISKIGNFSDNLLLICSSFNVANWIRSLLFFGIQVHFQQAMFEEDLDIIAQEYFYI